MIRGTSDCSNCLALLIATPTTAWCRSFNLGADYKVCARILLYPMFSILRHQNSMHDVEPKLLL